MVLHNSTLLDLTGCGQLMDWVADGHGCIVEMKRMMKRTTEFNQALSMLYQFIEGDAQGQIIRITDTRLLLLPRGAVVFGARKWKGLPSRATTSRTCMNEGATH